MGITQCDLVYLADPKITRKTIKNIKLLKTKSQDNIFNPIENKIKIIKFNFQSTIVERYN
jgi:hypothetical protein